MDRSQLQAFTTSLQPLGRIFRTELTKILIDIYWEALKDLPLENVQCACASALKQEKFFPVPATLRELAGCSTAKLDTAEEAWYRLRHPQHRYNREALSDPLTREVFEAMGGGYVLEWGFGNWPTTQEERKRQEFMNRYREAQTSKALITAQEQRHG